MSANYKDTLLLPKTDFPMKADLVKYAKITKDAGIKPDL